MNAMMTMALRGVYWRSRRCKSKVDSTNVSVTMRERFMGGRRDGEVDG